jgi:O-antigen ligase
MTAIICIAVLVGLVWGTVFLFRGSLLCGGLVFLVVGCCFGHRLINFDFGPFPLTLERVLLGGLIFAYLIQRRLGIADPKPPSRGDVAMFLFAGLLVVSTFTHSWRVDVPGKGSPVWQLVAGYLMPIALYWIARQSRASKRSSLLVFGFLTVFGVYLAVTALAETAQQWWLVYPKYTRDPSVGIHFGRARGPLLQSQSFGLYLAVCLVGAWLWRPWLGRFGQLVLILLYPVFLAAIFFTYTRCVWMGTALGGLIVLGLSLRGTWRPLVLGSALAAGLLGTIFAWDRIVELNREQGAAAARSSAECRLSFTYVSWKMFLDRPLLGCGFGQFSDAKRPYLADRATALHLEGIRYYPHHNTFLSLLTETGLIGLALFVAVLVDWTRGAWRMWRSSAAPDWVRSQGLAMLGVLGIYLCCAVFFDLSYSPNDHWIVFLLAGATAGLRPLAGPQTSASLAGRRDPLPALAPAT